jgi:branched-chain amino acid transport system substrate-binding protein
MKRILSIALVSVLAVFTVSAADLKVGVLCGLTGPAPSFGQSEKDGIMLAIDEWNAKGGVLGQKIVPVVEDGQCDAAASVNAANKVITQDGVKFIIGETCSGSTIPVTEIANASKIVLMGATSTSQFVTVDSKSGKTKDYIFRVCYIDPFQGNILGQFAATRLKAKKAFVLYDQGNDYTIGMSTAFEAKFKAMGGAIVGKETYTKTDTDFSAILAKVKNAKPDVVVLPDYYNIVNLVMKQAREKGITAPFIGGDGWDSPDLDKAVAEGGYYTNHYSKDDPRAEVQDFLKSFGKAYQDDKGKARTPDAFAVLGYDAANLLFSGIKAAGSTDPDKVKAALEAIKFSGVTGKLTMDKAHNPVKAATILAVKGGKIVFDSVVQP